MPSNDPVAARVVRRVVRRAVGDAAYRRTLLANPNEVMGVELARSGSPVPDIQFDAVEQTENSLVVRVPISEFERRVQGVLQPLFKFVDSASEADLARFVRAPRQKLEQLLGIEFEEDIHVVVRVESQGQRVLVVPQDAFGLINPDSDVAPKAKIKLCPKAKTIDLCPKDKTVVLCPERVTIDLCPAGCTFTEDCGCTISNTDTGDFPTIPEIALSPDATPKDSVKKLSDLLDE